MKPTAQYFFENDGFSAESEVSESSDALVDPDLSPDAVSDLLFVSDPDSFAEVVSDSLEALVEPLSDEFFVLFG